MVNRTKLILLLRYRDYTDIHTDIQRYRHIDTHLHTPLQKYRHTEKPTEIQRKYRDLEIDIFRDTTNLEIQRFRDTEI